MASVSAPRRTPSGIGHFPRAARALMDSFSTSNINHDTFKSVGSPVPRWRRKPQEDRTMKSIIRKDEAAVSPVIATILMVAITVVLAAVLYVMVSGLLTPTGQGPRVMGVNIGTSGDGTNWTLLITSTPSGVRNRTGLNSIPAYIAFAAFCLNNYSALTSGAWNTNKAHFVRTG